MTTPKAPLAVLHTAASQNQHPVE